MTGVGESPEDFATLFESAFGRLQVAIVEACGVEEGWPQKVAAGVRAGLEHAAADPATAELLTRKAVAGGPDGIARHDRLVSYLAERLRPGREERPGGAGLPEVTERAMAGGVLMLVAQRLDQGREDELVALVPEAIQFVLTPYLGAEEARRIATESAN